MDFKRHSLLLAGMVLLAALHLQGCWPQSKAPSPAPTQAASAPPAETPAVRPGRGGAPTAIAPPPPPQPAGASSPYPHVEAIFYAETPEQVGEVSRACLEILPPGVSASSVNPTAYQCKPESAAMTRGSPVSKDDGTPGVDTAEYMKAALDFDSDDFEVPTRELLLHFTSPGQHKSFEFQVIPKRIGDRRLSVQLFTTDKDGVVIDDIFDGSSTVHVNVGHDAVENLGWLLEHWEALTGVAVSLAALWALLTGRPLAWWRRRRAAIDAARPKD